MSEVKDPKIKLFGKTIELAEASAVTQSCVVAGEDGLIEESPCLSDSSPEDGGSEEQESQKSLLGVKDNHSKEEDRSEPLTSEEFIDSNSTPSTVQDSKTPSADSDIASAKMPKPEDDQSETSNLQEKTLKKPDKILPCPRCNSMDTKFCYFNNYNVNQPRHFCRNCQRYWTAGGTMRNVPVGAGRRKNKSSVSQFRTVPEARVDLPNGIHQPGLNPNGTVLSFGSDSPLCETMASVLNTIDKTIRNTSRNGICKPEEVTNSVCNGFKESEDRKDDTGKPELIPNCHPFPPLLPGFPGGPWPYPWNYSPVMPPTFGPAAFPLPFYSTAQPYWGCAVPGGWNVPVAVPFRPTAVQVHTPPSSGPNSPTLGKHSRDDNVNLKLANTKGDEILKETNPEKSLWVPKTLRIDDPEEAAKSSIWATLGIKNDKIESGMFKAFQTQSKSDEKMIHNRDASTVLQANPAALSRSVSFHERS